MCRRYTDSGGLQMLIVHKCWLLNRCCSYTQAGVTYNRSLFTQVSYGRCSQYTGIQQCAHITSGRCYTSASVTQMQMKCRFLSSTGACFRHMLMLHRCRFYTGADVTQVKVLYMRWLYARATCLLLSSQNFRSYCTGMILVRNNTKHLVKKTFECLSMSFI